VQSPHACGAPRPKHDAAARHFGRRIGRSRGWRIVLARTAESSLRDVAAMLIAEKDYRDTIWARSLLGRASRIIWCSQVRVRSYGDYGTVGELFAQKCCKADTMRPDSLPST
jgi:hypothetical protein